MDPAFGNSLTISVIWRTKSLQVASNFLLASLAFADLLVSVILVPVRASQHMAFYHGVTVPGIVVEIASFVGRVNIIASISSLTAMSIDRYIALHHPLLYLTSVKFAKRKTCFVISCIWACSIVVTSVPEFPGVMDMPFLVFFVTIVLMATLIITAAYYKIFKVARKSIRTHRAGKLVTKGKRSSRRTTSYDISPSVQHDTQTYGQKKEKKMAATIAFVIGAFVVSVYPRIVLILHHFATPETPESRLARFWFRILLYSNSVMNPALYVWRHKEFKREFMKILLRIWQCLSC